MASVTAILLKNCFEILKFRLISIKNINAEINLNDSKYSLKNRKNVIEYQIQSNSKFSLIPFKRSM